VARPAAARAVLAGVVFAGLVTLAAQTPSDEDVARRQIESGRAFARQGNYVEALKDFRAVADTHPSSSVADNALLEMARYYLDVAEDTKEAAAAVDAILKKYATSDAAPDAYVLMGRLALARGHQPADLESAMANFERVTRLFPDSDAVPRSLVLAADVFFYQNRLDEARANLARVAAEYPGSTAAAQAGLSAARVLVAGGDPVGAMEELQQVRNHWPSAPEAAVALSRLTLLHRLYIRATNGPAFAPVAETPGPAKLADVSGLVIDRRGTLFWASATGIAGVDREGRPAPSVPAVARPRGLAAEIDGGVVAFDTGSLKRAAGPDIPIAVTRTNGFKEPLVKIEAAAQLSNGDWLVADEDEKAIHRLGRTGEYVGVFAPIRASRLAVSPADEVAAIDRDQKSLALFDASGRAVGRLPTKTAAYDLENPVDVAYDTFGHLYVLGRAALGVFGTTAPAPASATAPADRGAAYRLLTLFAEAERLPTAFRRATAFAVDASGGVILFDDRAERLKVYR
jgi:TolA-binding protein